MMRRRERRGRTKNKMWQKGKISRVKCRGRRRCKDV